MEIQQLAGKGQRETNQDLICIDRLQSGASFFLIADGMGGYEKGDDAARIISENIFTFLKNTEVIDEQFIQQAVQKANLAIKQFNTENNIKSGATIGGVILEKDITHFFWVGDVMIYQIHRDQVLFKTKSHTLINSLLESKRIPDEKSLEKYRHVVTRSISGKSSESKIGYHTFTSSEEDFFILCSDGVHNFISIEQLLLFLNQNNDLLEIEKQLLLQSHDNYSIITIRYR